MEIRLEKSYQAETFELSDLPLERRGPISNPPQLQKSKKAAGLLAVPEF